MFLDYKVEDRHSAPDVCIPKGTHRIADQVPRLQNSEWRYQVLCSVIAGCASPAVEHLEKGD